MFTPWGKVLCQLNNANKINLEDVYANEATFLCSLKSIPTQLIYDIILATFYTLIAIPSALMGACYLLYCSCIEKDTKKQQAQKKFAEEICLGNLLLSPYFAMAILIDFFRECCALFSRTYATLIQTSEESDTFNCSMG